MKYTNNFKSIPPLLLIFLIFCLFNTTYYTAAFSQKQQETKTLEHITQKTNEEAFIPGQIIVQLEQPLDLNTKNQSFLAKGLDQFNYKINSIIPIFQNLSTQLKRDQTFSAFISEQNQKPTTLDVSKVQNTLNALSSTYLITVDKNTDITKLCSQLNKNGACIYAEPNWKFHSFFTQPNDQYLSSKGSWGQTYDDLWGLKAMEVPTAWERSAGKDVIIAIVDTGIDYTHPDLSTNIWKNTKEIANNGIDDDNNGYIDDSIGWDFGGTKVDDFNDNDNDPRDTYGHGTHVAGITGAVGNNKIGVIGVAHQAQLMAVKVFPDRLPYGALSDIAQGIEYAARNKADVINISLGGPRSHLIEDVINLANTSGVTVVAAAGNSGIATESVSPAELNSVITVGAYDPNLQLANFSNVGPKLDVVAPGVDILSCLASDAAIAESAAGRQRIVTGEDGSKYLRLSGTSMASPYVAGVAAIIRARFPTFTNEQIRQVIKSSTDQNTLSTDNRFNNKMGFGKIKASLAIGQLERGQPLRVRIISPTPYKYFFNSQQVSITGTVSGQEFDSYAVYVGRGESPTQWTQIATSNQPSENKELAIWNPSSNDTDGIYMLRIVAKNKVGFSYIDQTSIYLINDVDLLAGWPIAFGGSTIANSAVADLDGDGKTEIVIVGKSVFDYGMITVLNNKGESLNNAWPKPVNGLVQCSVTLADLDGDRKFEIIVSGHQPGPTVYAYHYDGSSVTGFPVSLNNFNTISPFPLPSATAADINGDGRPEILMIGGGFTQNDPPQLVTINGSGQILWKATLPQVAIQQVQEVINTGACTPMVGDITGDTSPEIVVAYSQRQENTDSFYTSYFAYDNRGKLLRGWPITIGPNDSENSLSNTGALADLDGDGKLDVIINQDPKGNFPNPQCLAFQGNGRPLSGWPQTASEPGHIVVPPAVGDLDGDGKPEVVFRTSQQLIAYHGDGTIVKGFPVTAASTFSYSPPVIGDIDGDKKTEILFSGSSTTPFTDPNYYLFCYRSDGQAYPNWPKKILASQNSLYIWSGFTLGDIDNDGKVDAIFPAVERIYAFHFPGAYRKENIPWGTYQQNPGRTGALKN